MAETFTSFQRLMWQYLAYFGVFRFYIDVTAKGQYKICRHVVGSILYWPLWANNIFKFIYHVLTYHSLLGIKVHFLDQMSLVDWLLMFSHAIFEGLVWSFKYPMWENLYRQWEVQDDIYRKLGRPKHVADKITKTDKFNFVMYFGICSIGTVALIVQFYQSPKYALNTYALLSADTFFLRLIFCFHEVCFMFHTYIYQAFTMVCAESFACSYQHILEEMNKAMREVIFLTRRKTSCNLKRMHIKEKVMETSNKLKIPSTSAKLSNGMMVNGPTVTEISPQYSEYDIKGLLTDYKKVMISAQFHNQWVGAIMGFPEAINFVQFVSDVFMMIQLLKEDDADYLGIFFYFFDCMVGMAMVFRMLILLARLYPQSIIFLKGLKEYSSLKTPFRKELRKTITSLHVVAAKLTGYSMRPESVPIGVNVLINYYICAAMWHRPTDPSRRT